MINDIKGNINITQNLNVSGNVNINNNLNIEGITSVGTDKPSSALQTSDTYKLHVYDNTDTNGSFIRIESDTGIHGRPAGIEFITACDSTILNPPRKFSSGRIISEWPLGTSTNYNDSVVQIQNRKNNNTPSWINTLTCKAGNVGIGTISPIKHLDVRGDIRNNGMLIFKVDIGDWHTGNVYNTQWVNRSFHTSQDDGAYVRNYIRMQTPTNSNGYTNATVSPHGDVQDWYIGTIYTGTYSTLMFSTGTHQSNADYPDRIRYSGYVYSGFNNTSTSSNLGDQMNFTGQHRCVPQNIDFYNNIDNYIGLIVYATGDYKTYSNSQEKLTTDKEAITINDSLPIIDLSNKKKQKSVFGIISNKEEEERTFRAGVFCTPYPNINDDKKLYINSVGEGAIWIVNTNGNLENGDYIQASDVIGMGEKQDGEFLANYTVAKITCDCNFDTNSTKYNCVEFVDPTSGNTYKKAFVGCSYHCG